MVRSWIKLVVAALVVCGCGDTINQVGPLGPSRGQIVALTVTGVLFWVDPAAPDIVIGAVNTTGLQAGDTLVSIAYRPANGALYGRGKNGALYLVDPATGITNQVGAFAVIFGGASTYGSAFSPVADKLRVVTNNHQNVRIDPVTAQGVFDDTLGTAAVIGAIAYTPPAQGATTLYGLDQTNHQLVMIGGTGGVPSPNNGAVTPVGPLGLGSFGTSATGFTIATSGTAYAALQLGDDLVTKLYTINLTTGAATLVAPVGSGGRLRGIALAP